MARRTPYPDEFTHEAVRLVTETGLPRTQVARDLGIDPQTLRRWVQTTAQPAAPAGEPASAAELARLRRENEQLRMERDILKKAVGIFSRMPQ